MQSPRQWSTSSSYFSYNFSEWVQCFRLVKHFLVSVTHPRIIVGLSFILSKVWWLKFWEVYCNRRASGMFVGTNHECRRQCRRMPSAGQTCDNGTIMYTMWQGVVCKWVERDKFLTFPWVTFLAPLRPLQMQYLAPAARMGISYFTKRGRLFTNCNASVQLDSAPCTTIKHAYMTLGPCIHDDIGPCSSWQSM